MNMNPLLFLSYGIRIEQKKKKKDGDGGDDDEDPWKNPTDLTEITKTKPEKKKYNEEKNE